MELERRTFLAVMGGAGMQGQPGAPGRARFLVLENFYLKNGDQGARLAEYLAKGRPAGVAPRLVLEALVAAHMPQVMTVTAFPSLDAIAQAKAALARDKAAAEALARWEAGPEAPYEHYSESVLELTDYSPPLPPPNPEAKASRVFELRVYHSPTERQLRALHERFAGPEIKIFARCGIHPVFYSSTFAGPHKPNLVYLTPFENLAAREKAWAAFGADPEWIKVRRESIEAHGQISSVIQMSLFRAAAYSPLR
jgi:hypothetical protein